MFVLNGILRAESQEKILVYLLVRETGYGKAIAEFFDLSQNAVQKQLVRLEDDGIVISTAVGKLREYQFNPRYPFLGPLKTLLKAAIEAYPKDIRRKLAVNRTRPRKAGKTTAAVR